MIEHAHIDLLDASSRIVQFTSADDALWSGVMVLAPGETATLASGGRHDLLVLEGMVDVDDGRTLARGDFAIRNGSPVLRAGPEGAQVFGWRDTCCKSCEETTVHRADQPWREGRTPGMLAANLSNDGHALNLVQWQPGVLTHQHAHPGGEEIFVLRGELCEGARRPVGSWMRLHPGAWHAPHVETPTLLLVRSGHLKGRPKAP